jgi:hypothetical protein
MDEIHCCGMALRMSPTSKRDKERRGRFSLKADANTVEKQILFEHIQFSARWIDLVYV